MVAACRAVGLNGDEAHLIRLGENALYRLDTPGVIVRIARSADYLPAVRRDVLVSRWLERVGFPAARVLDDVEQPLVVDGHPVTFWYRINEGDRDATYGELSAVLRDLHALAVPDELGLERLPVFGRTAVRIERAIGVPEDDLAFLRQRGRELEGLLSELRFESPVGPLHGDAHTGNLIVDRAGRVASPSKRPVSAVVWMR
jgi:hypothetical protein